jgi:hypothetical protein
MQVSEAQASEVFEVVKRADYGFAFDAGGVHYFVSRPFNGAHDHEFLIGFHSPKGANVEVAIVISEPAIIHTYVDRAEVGRQVRDTAEIEPPALRTIVAKAIRATLRQCQTMTSKRQKDAAAAEKAKLRAIARKI